MSILVNNTLRDKFPFSEQHFSEQHISNCGCIKCQLLEPDYCQQCGDTIYWAILDIPDEKIGDHCLKCQEYIDNKNDKKAKKLAKHRNQLAKRNLRPLGRIK